MIRQFHRPSTIAEALILKKTLGDDAIWFSGGAHINRADFRNLPEQVICLAQLQLTAIRKKGSDLEIGAGTPLQEILDNRHTPEALKQAIRDAAPRTTRNLATIGGDVAMGGRITRLTPCLIALGARLVLGRGEELPLDGFTDRDELITSLVIPLTERRCVTRKLSHQANAEALCLVSVSMETAVEGRISNPVVAIGAIEAVTRRLTGLERSLQSGGTPDFQSLQAAAAVAIATTADLFGSAEYKKYAAGQVVAECVMSCFKGDV